VFRVAPDKSDVTLAYLREREQVTDVYVETMKPVSLLDGSGRELEALCYIVDRGHPQYAGQLSMERQARLVRSAAGRSGTNIDYVLNTVRHLEEAGIHDVELMALAQRLAAGDSV
jgi:cation transport protein ChaC